jgi:benzoyl-CoA reductase/2-hydroxyglutaryl-CoA dehydratase subunit BcrC/BadD/HgdB
MRSFEKFFEERRCALAAATYASSWAGIEDAAELATADARASLAASYLNLYINSGFAQRIRYLARMIAEFRLTGFIMHSNRSCKPYSVGMYRLKEELCRLTGKPGVVIEADQNDPRVFSEDQVEARLEAFIEAMASHA